MLVPVTVAVGLFTAAFVTDYAGYHWSIRAAVVTEKFIVPYKLVAKRTSVRKESANKRLR